MEDSKEPVFPENINQEPMDFYDSDDYIEEPDEMTKLFTLLFESTKNNEIEIVKEILTQHQDAYEFRDEVLFNYFLKFNFTFANFSSNY